MFQRLEYDEALLVDSGVYKPAEVYAGPDGGLFVKAKGGFLRVKGDGSTSHHSVKLERLYREAPLYADAFNRLAVTEAPGRKRVAVIPKDDGPCQIKQIAVDKIP